MKNVHSCHRCESILIESEPTGTYQKSFELFLSDFVYYATGPDPCQFFAMLLSMCRWPEGYFDKVKPTTRVALQYDSSIDSSFTLSVATLPRNQESQTRNTSTASKYGELLAFNCQIVTDSDDVAAIDVPGRILSPVFDDSTVTLIRSWYSECRHRHPDCQHPFITPRRLLYVGDSEDDRMRLRLFEKQIETDVVDYAALSYIWGGPQQFQTTEENIKSRTSAIDIKSLPKTLIDAVLACRALGFRWLWVDVLCIIQDNRFDKLENINAMGDIFRNAAVTLVAATSQSSNEGFLSNTFDNTISPLIRCRYKVSDGKAGYVYLIKKRNEESRFPIETRGWTMQERLLSPRLLFFHTGRIDWVCRTSHLFAGCSSSYSVNLIDESVARNRAWDTFELSSMTTNPSPAEQLERWYSLCSSFSERQLTVPTDRLLAFSGIAKEFQSHFPGAGEYIAGLWETNFTQQLLWRSYGAEQIAYKHKAYIAPSWSWASIQGEFMLPTFASHPADIRLDILDVKVQPVHGSDRYGELESAYLKVRGRLKVASWDISKQMIEAEDGLSALGNTNTIVDSLEHAPEGPFSGASLQVHCLEIQDARYWARFIKTEWGPAYSGLLLLPYKDRPATFQRVGMFSLAKVDKHEARYAVIASAVKNLAWFENAEVQDITLV